MPLTKREVALRNALADYMRAEGCSCCRQEEDHVDAKKRLMEMLEVPRFDDDSGWNFWEFCTPKR